MKKKFLVCFAIVLLAAVSAVNTVSASAILDSTGGDYYFQWDAPLPTQIGSIYATDGPGSANINWANLGNDFSVSATDNTYLNMATAWDDFLAGDIFGLTLDGTALAWTSTYTDTHGYFHGVYENLLLTSGTHLISLKVLSGLSLGGAWISFSGTSPAANPTPEPSTMLLLGFGMLGLAGVARKKMRK